MQAPKLTDQILCLPVTRGGVWEITQYINGDANTMAMDKFYAFVTTLNKRKSLILTLKHLPWHSGRYMNRCFTWSIQK